MPELEESVGQLEETLWAAEEKLLAVRAVRQGVSKQHEGRRR